MAAYEIRCRNQHYRMADPLQRLWINATRVLGYSLEAKFAGLVFDIMVGACEENTLDEYWLGVLGKILLAFVERNTGSPSRKPKLIDRLIQELGSENRCACSCGSNRGISPSIAASSGDHLSMFRSRLRCQMPDAQRLLMNGFCCDDLQ